jgi:hypothetical protein
MFNMKMNFTDKIGNGNASLDLDISAYRSIFQAIVASDEDARRAMFMIFSNAVFAFFYERKIIGKLSASFSLDCAEIFTTFYYLEARNRVKRV